MQQKAELCTQPSATYHIMRNAVTGMVTGKGRYNLWTNGVRPTRQRLDSRKEGASLRSGVGGHKVLRAGRWVAPSEIGRLCSKGSKRVHNCPVLNTALSDKTKLCNKQQAAKQHQLRRTITKSEPGQKPSRCLARLRRTPTPVTFDRNDSQRLPNTTK